MDEKHEFKRLVTEYLVPLFQQAKLGRAKPRVVRSLVSYESRKFGKTALRLQRQMRKANQAFLLKRSQEFTSEERGTAQAFVETILEVLPHAAEPYCGSLADVRMGEAVARAVGARNPQTVAEVISTFARWSQETYEGHRISAAIGVSADDSAGGQPLGEFLKLNLAKIASDGCSALVVVSSNGNVTGHKYLPQPGMHDKTFAPFAFVPVAKWARTGRVAVALNRNGEILVFANGMLMFARRRGGWRHFSHEATVRQMAIGYGNKFTEGLRTAAYLSTLDISFARAGGTTGLVRRGEESGITEPTGPVSRRDVLDPLGSDASEKTKAIAALVHGRTYQSLGRPLRQALGGVDGAVVLDRMGRLLCAGAILTVRVSSDEGARKTAARTLGRYGLGIKISSDGKIEAYAGRPVRGQRTLFEVG